VNSDGRADFIVHSASCSGFCVAVIYSLFSIREFQLANHQITDYGLRTADYGYDYVTTRAPARRSRFAFHVSRLPPITNHWSLIT